MTKKCGGKKPPKKINIMAAPKGNNYYTLRKRSGRKRIFEDPADMEALS